MPKIIKKFSVSHTQKGFSLLESMIAIIVMVLGILGVLGAQMKTLTDTQSSVRRAQAIRLIGDLGERLQNNPDALGNLSTYTTNPTSSNDCSSAVCTPSELATYDIKQWRTNVANTLPSSNVNIFLPQNSTNQLGVVIAWSENKYLQNGKELTTDENDKLNAPLAINSATDSSGSAVSCPTGLTCHLQYIQPMQRCTPWAIGGGSLYCPN